MESPASCSASSAGLAPSSVTQQSPRRAVMLKGPSLTSKTFFVPLPDTLDELIAKATQLFSLPPGKVPHITLGTDERAIILDESYSFIRDRELLHFRWTADTPRRSLANRVRWDDPANSAASTHASPVQALASSSKLAEASLFSPASEALKSQMQTSPSRDVASTTKANTLANRDPNTQFGEGLAARKAHAQRVLDEQKRKREEENMAEALGSAPMGDADVEVMTDTPEDTDSIVQTNAVPKADAGLASPTREASCTENEQRTVEAEQGGTEAAALKTVSPATSQLVIINSPPRKKHADNVGLDTPPSSGSRSNSPYLSSDRAIASGPNNTQNGDEQSSSPIQSPTRDLTRQRLLFSIENIPKALTSASELDLHKQVQDVDDIQPVECSEALEELPSGNQEASIATLDMLDDAFPQIQEEGEVVLATATKSVSKIEASATNVKELNRIYGFLSNLVSQLLSHRSNWAFQRPMSSEFEQFSSRCSRPVDLFTIRDNLACRKYGSQLLTGRVAANAVLTDFEADLSLLYNNARRFFGTKSTQAECVDHLEKFSKSFLNEWKRTQETVRSESVKSRPVQMPNRPGLPLSRIEKHSSPAQAKDFPFGPMSNIFSGSIPVKKSVSANGSTTRTPEFLSKRASSFEGSFAQASVKRAAPPSITSEAFERALRAPSSTPQADRVKPRIDVMAPFSTRSVIETFRSVIPEPEPQAKDVTSQGTDQGQSISAPAPIALTPSKRKRLSGEMQGESSSPSPPPSPSPVKRAAPSTLTPSSNFGSKKEKKKAKQQRAAAAAAAAASEAKVSQDGTSLMQGSRSRKDTSLAEQAEEQFVLDLIDPEQPSRKRAKKGKKAGKNTTDQTTLSRSLRPRRSSSTATPDEPKPSLSAVPPPKTPPRRKETLLRSTKKLTNHQTHENMDNDGFEIISQRRSSRPKKPVRTK